MTAAITAAIDPSLLRDCCVLVPVMLIVFGLGFTLGRRKRRSPLQHIKDLGACSRDSFARGAAYGYSKTENAGRASSGRD